MIRSSVCLILLGVGLGYSALWKGGVWAVDWNVTLVSIAMAAVVYWVRGRKGPQVGPGLGWLGWPLVLLPAYLAFQLIPWPEGLLKILSPNRWELLRGVQGLAPGVHSAPLSVVPPASISELFRYLGFIVTFLLVRELAGRFSDHPWLITSPLLAIGCLEAVLGMFQIAAAWPNGQARGTFVDRDHFAALLEMTLPFAIMYGVAVWRRADLKFSSPARPAVLACLLLGLGALMLLGIIYSLSRMGFLVALATLFLLAVLAAGRKKSLWALAAAILILFVFLPPNQLIVRFADLASTDRVSGDTRLLYWQESLSLIAAYPVFGIGLGSFDSAFRKFQRTTPLLSVDYAHNDYLQFLAELGAVGFAILAVLVGGVIWKTARTAMGQEDVNRQCLATACLGAMVAILLHSLVDFPLQIPVNGMVFAWICGMGVSVREV